MPRINVFIPKDDKLAERRCSNRSAWSAENSTNYPRWCDRLSTSPPVACTTNRLELEGLVLGYGFPRPKFCVRELCTVCSRWQRREICNFSQRRKCSSVSVSSAFPSERSAKAHLIGCKLLFRCVLEMSLVTFLQWNTVASTQQVLLYAFLKFRYSLQRTLGTVSACTRMALMIKQFATERSALKMMTRRKDDATSIISQQLFLLMNCNLYLECSAVCHGCV